jgi:hypothetical protein
MVHTRGTRMDTGTWSTAPKITLFARRIMPSSPRLFMLRPRSRSAGSCLSTSGSINHYVGVV